MPERSWIYVVDGDTAGPVSESVLLQLAANGHVDGSTLVWSEGLDQWTPLPAAGIEGLTVPPETGDAVVSIPPTLPVSGVPSQGATVAFYLGWLSLLVVPGPLALVAGGKALQDMRRVERRTGIRPGGSGRAAFGLLMGTFATTLLAWVIITAAI